MPKYSEYQLKKKNDAMLKRLSKQRQNKNNWNGWVFTPRRERSVADAEDFMFEDKKYQPKSIYR